MSVFKCHVFGASCDELLLDVLAPEVQPACVRDVDGQFLTSWQSSRRLEALEAAVGGERAETSSG